MKPLLLLTLTSMLLFSNAFESIAADRDAADRQTRQESDELRADIRQQRLKKVKALDGLAQPEAPVQNPEEAKSGSKSGE